MQVRHLSRDELERRTTELLARCVLGCLSEPRFTPVAEITLLECQRLAATIVLDADLGLNAAGQRILGSCKITAPYMIRISRELDANGPRFRFTLAHELGHLELHRDLELEDVGIQGGDIEDGRGDLFQGRREVHTQRQWLEWQANNFAAALLLPNKMLRRALITRQVQLDHRKPGMIYLDHQPANRIAAHQLIRELAHKFDTSKTTLIYRMKALGLLVESNWHA
jgi:Zn-dependent peptidase ImmA (M78 family)